MTICTKDREELFGEIKNGEMVLNELGKIVFKNLKNIPYYFENINLDKFIVMPNHVHLILEINKNIVGAIHELPLQKRRNMLIPKIIGKFKMLSAKEINILANNSGNPLWQRNYYDHIIRNEIELNKIREYILENPKNWERDRNNIV
ncbi:MAG TPA: transposase [Candidatus Moranbacteria bacterium]|nr:transposase [Candidatus Moranbacteria bacterium]